MIQQQKPRPVDLVRLDPTGRLENRQPTPEIAGLMIRVYYSNHWFPLIRPAIKPLFLGGAVTLGVVFKDFFLRFATGCPVGS